MFEQKLTDEKLKWKDPRESDFLFLIHLENLGIQLPRSITFAPIRRQTRWSIKNVASWNFQFTVFRGNIQLQQDSCDDCLLGNRAMLINDASLIVPSIVSAVAEKRLFASNSFPESNEIPRNAGKVSEKTTDEYSARENFQVVENFWNVNCVSQRLRYFCIMPHPFRVSTSGKCLFRERIDIFASQRDEGRSTLDYCRCAKWKPVFRWSGRGSWIFAFWKSISV